MSVPDPVSKPLRKLREYAAEYKVSLRTVKRWRQAGLPIDAPLALLKIVGTKRHVPPALRTVLGRHNNIKKRREQLSFAKQNE